MRRGLSWAVAAVLLVMPVGCSSGPEPGCSGGGNSCGDPSPAGSAGAVPGDPNAAGRAVAAGTASGAPSVSVLPAMPGGSAGICANETLGESMTRAVDAGSTIVIATGGFTGTTIVADGEIGVPYSQVQLTVERVLAGAPVDPALSTWVYGDLGAPAGTATTTGEASSLWASGGRMIAVVDGAGQLSGLDGPVIRVAPVVGDEVILSWVGCWPTSGVSTLEFDGDLEIFDERGLHPTDLQLVATPLTAFEAVLPQ